MSEQKLEEVIAVLKALMENPYIDLGDLVYTVRDRECKGWEGEYVTRWGNAVEAAKDIIRLHTLNAEPQSTFAPTCKHQIVKSKEPIYYVTSRTCSELKITSVIPVYKETHQQLWVDANGNEEWRDVPTVEEGVNEI